jgi:drug/metabolite transporter (DMT)-like permease
VACAAGSATAYGVTIICGRRLATEGFSTSTTLGVRFAIAAVLIVLSLVVTRSPLLPEPGERLRALLLGLVGYTTESSFFYMGLQHGTAGAVALLFYAYPAIVLMMEMALGSQPRRWRSVGVLVLSSVGAGLVIAAGEEVRISALGVVFSLASAVAIAIYLLASARLVKRSDARVTGAWVAIGCAVSFLARAGFDGGPSLPAKWWPLASVNGAATAIAFVLLFAALRRLGPSSTSIVMTLEAFVAILLAAVLLDEPVAPLQLVGGVAIVAAAVVVARSRTEATAVPLSPQEGP